MHLLSRPEQIWVLRPEKEDLIAGAKYAARTLPWTFNRMMLNTGSKGQQTRALNIAKGIVGQEMLRRKLQQRGVITQVQRKSHRNEDLFDFHLKLGGKLKKLDIKSWHYFTDYRDVGRAPFSTKLIIENSSYPGPDWRRFFPMLVPHTQIEQSKEAYCFAIASSVELRTNIDTERVGYALTAFPYGETMRFLSAKRLCLAREEAGRGFHVKGAYVPGSIFNGEGITLAILGEWDGEVREDKIRLDPRRAGARVGPFSCILSFQVDREDYDKFYGRVEVTVVRNAFKDVVLNSARQNVNLVPDGALYLTRADFCNLMLPSDYTLYTLGWALKGEYLERCRDYTGWVWPNDSDDKYKNQPWSQITARDRETITRAGFADCIQEKPRLVNAGWMKTNGKGGGACCYVYPNIGMYGGVKETNLYVLPKDLRIMAELGK